MPEAIGETEGAGKSAPKKEAKADPKGGAKQAEPGTKATGPGKAKPARIASAVAPGRRAPRGRAAARSCSAAGAQARVPGWYVVRSGDTLWAIAARHYGAGPRYTRIYAANRRSIRSPHRIFPCQRVYLPKAPARRA